MMSILGSSFIIFEVLKNPQKRTMAYHLQMLALSCADILFSLSLFILNWPAPDSGWCKARGFLDLLSGTPQAMYSAGVCVYYMFFIYFGWDEEKILRYQRVLIIFPIMWGLMVSILSLTLGMINPTNVLRECWLYPTPQGCTGADCTPDEKYYEIFRIILITIPIWVFFVVALVSMCLVYFKVSKDEEEYKDKKAPTGWLWFIQKEEGKDISRQVRSRRMARQAFLYLSNFFMAYIGGTAWSIVDSYDHLGGTEVPFGLWLFTSIFLPWQGFWNAVIYVRPRYMRNRERYPNLPVWRAITKEDEYDHRLGALAIRSTGRMAQEVQDLFEEVEEEKAMEMEEHENEKVVLDDT